MLLGLLQYQNKSVQRHRFFQIDFPLQTEQKILYFQLICCYQTILRPYVPRCSMFCTAFSLGRLGRHLPFYLVSSLLAVKQGSPEKQARNACKHKKLAQRVAAFIYCTFYLFF